MVAYVGTGFGTLLASFVLETFLFRRLIKARLELVPWNRELNALSLILAALVGGTVAVRLAQSSARLEVALPEKLRGMLRGFERKRSPLLAIAAAAGAGCLLWLLRGAVPYNPLTVGWRGMLMSAAAAAAGGSLWIGGRTKLLTWATMLAAVGVGFASVGYDSYTFEVTIPSARALLRGEIVVPGRDAQALYPGVLLVHDVGCHDRNGTWGVNQPLREIAEHLAENGYVVLRYDKRGCGESGGVFIQSGREDFTRDAIAAGTLLSSQAHVQGQPTFAIGHGVGGQIITAAAQAQLELFAGLVLLATPAADVAEWLKAEYRYRLTALGASPAEIEAWLATVEDWIAGVQNRRYLNYGDYFGVRGLPEPLQAEQRRRPIPPVWLRQALAFDQPAALASLRLPVLILAGEADWQVASSEVALMTAALRKAGPAQWEAYVLPDVNHQLIKVPSTESGFLMAQDDDYANRHHPVAQDLLATLVDWLNGITARWSP